MCVQEVRDDHAARGGAAVQVLPGGQLPAAPPRQLRLRDRARLRLGLPRPVRARPLQLLAGQVHQVLLLRHLLLPEQGGTRVAAMFLVSESVFVLLQTVLCFSSCSTRTGWRRAGSTCSRTPPTSTRGGATSGCWATRRTRWCTAGRTSRPCSTAARARG